MIHVSGALDDDQRARLAAAVADPLLQNTSWDAPHSDGIEVTFLPGVTDTAADAVMHAALQLGIELTAAATARRIEFGPVVDADLADEIVRRVVANVVIERWGHGLVEPPHLDDAPGHADAELITIRGLDDEGLLALNVDRSLYLDLEELPRDSRPVRTPRPRHHRRRTRDARPDLERALRSQDVPSDRSHHRRTGRTHRVCHCSPSCATPPTRSTPRSCAAPSSATPASSF